MCGVDGDRPQGAAHADTPERMARSARAAPLMCGGPRLVASCRRTTSMNGERQRFRLRCRWRGPSCRWCSSLPRGPWSGRPHESPSRRGGVAHVAPIHPAGRRAYAERRSSPGVLTNSGADGTPMCVSKSQPCGCRAMSSRTSLRPSLRAEGGSQAAPQIDLQCREGLQGASRRVHPSRPCRSPRP